MNAAPTFPDFTQAPKSGLVHLRNEVEKYFINNSIAAVVAPVGLKYRSFSLNQAPGLGANRVVFIPGAFGGGTNVSPRAYGSLSRNTRNATSVINPRELAEWDRLVTISIWSAPLPGRAESEQDSISLVEDLLEQVIRAINNAVSPTGVNLAASISWGSITISAPPSDIAFGAELLVQLTQRVPLFDSALEVMQTLVLPQRGAVT